MVFPLEYIQYLNIIIIVFFIFYAYFGYKKGLLLMVLDIISTIIMFGIAFYLSPYASKYYNFIEAFVNIEEYEKIYDVVIDKLNVFIWFLIIFAIGNLIILFIKPIVKKIGELPLIGFANRVLGGLLGAFKAYLFSIILVFILSTPIFRNGSIVINMSYLKPIEDFTMLVSDSFSDGIEMQKAFQDIINGNILTDEKVSAIVDFVSDSLKNGELNEIVLDHFKDGASKSELEAINNQYFDGSISDEELDMIMEEYLADGLTEDELQEIIDKYFDGNIDEEELAAIIEDYLKNNLNQGQ